LHQLIMAGHTAEEGKMGNTDFDKKQTQHGSQKETGGEHSGQKPTPGQTGDKRNDEHNRPGGSGSQGGGQRSQSSS
jgi:hypothetical protein